MKLLFIDRDGTLINEPSGGYIDLLEKLIVLPHVIKSLQSLQLNGYKFVMISNQPGLGTDKFPDEAFWTPQNKLMGIFEENKIIFEEIFFCPHFREDNCNCMKPKTGLIDGFLKKESVDLKQSYTIGDRESDVELAKNIGCKSIFYSDKPNLNAVFSSCDWDKITDFILQGLTL